METTPNNKISKCWHKASALLFTCSIVISVASVVGAYLYANNMLLVLSFLCFASSWLFVEFSDEFKISVFSFRIALAAKTLAVNFTIYAGIFTLFFPEGMVITALALMVFIAVGLFRFHKIEASVKR